jgi:hypothetical protein
VVQGEVIDSISRVGVARVSVALLDTNGQAIDRTVTKADGRFLLYSPWPGEHRLRVSGEGYRPSTSPPFFLEVDDESGVRLLLARLEQPVEFTGEEMIHRVCQDGSVVGESGTILGVVRDLEGHPVVEADVMVSWPAVSAAWAQLMEGDVLDDVMVVTITDSSGFFAACGVPAQTAISFHAVRDGMWSDFNTVRFVRGGVEHGGVVHPSNDRLWFQALHVQPQQMHSAGVSGIIREEQAGIPVPNARVRLVGTELETTTDSTGHFALEGVPSGPAKLRIGAIGYYAKGVELQLQPQISIVLGAGALMLTRAPTELTPLEVTASAPTRRPLTDFTRRRQENVGMFITKDEFMQQGNPQTSTDVLRRMGGIKVLPNAGYDGSLDHPRFNIVMTRLAGPRTFGNSHLDLCAPLAFLDGHYLGTTNAIDVDRVINLEHVQAVEAYASVASMPIEFRRPGSECGVVAFWTM